MSASGPRVAYLLSAEDARNPIVSDADALVALMPEAANALEADGKAHLIPSDLRDPRLFQQYGRDAHELRTSWIASVDTELQESFPEFRESGFHPLRALAHPMTCLHESVLFAAHLLRESIRILQPARVWITPAPACRALEGPAIALPPWRPLHAAFARRLHALGRPPVPRHELYFRESLYALLLPAIAEAASVEFEAGPTLPEPASADLPPILEPTARIASSPRNAWLFASPSYELAPFREARERQGAPTLYAPELAIERPGLFPPYRLRRRLERFSREILRQDTTWRLFGEFGSALRRPLAGRLDFVFTGLLPSAWHNHLTALTVLRRTRPDVVIGGSTGYAWEMALLPAAAALGIPRAQYCHGWSQTPYPFAWNQLPEADLYLTWEDPERGSCGSSHVQERAVAVGSSRLQSLALRSRPDEASSIRERWRRPGRPLVLFAPNWVERSRRWVNCPEEPAWQFRFQRRVFDILANHSEIDVLWKPLLPWGFHPTLFRDPLPEHIRLVTDEPASRLVWAADLVVLDAISSPFAEAALTRAPILLLCRFPFLEVSDHDLAMVSRRAETFQDSEAFLDRLEAMLRRGQWSPLDSPDDAFLRDKNVDPETSVNGPVQRATAAISALLNIKRCQAPSFLEYFHRVRYQVILW